MAPRSDLILFCDLETTGTDRELDDIVEVGIAVFNWPEFRELAALDIVIQPRPTAFARMDGSHVVREMHKANGLYDELVAGEGAPDYATADAEIDEFLSRFGTRGSGHIPLAGSGVLHFDRPFIKLHLPLFDARLTHWAYDVGVMRRMFLLAGARHSDDSGKTHRALDDARVHAEEFRFYMERITKMFGVLREEADAAKAA